MAKFDHSGQRQKWRAQVAWREGREADLALRRKADDQAALIAAKRRLAEQDKQAAIRKAARDILAMRRLNQKTV